MVKTYLKLSLSSLLAGIFISLGATVNLQMIAAGHKIAGAFLFGIGLFFVVALSLWLYTGKVGFLTDNKPDYLLKLFVCLTFNLLGAAAFAYLVKLTRYGEGLTQTAQTIVSAKQNDTWYSVFILSVLCGMMIYLAVRGWRDFEGVFAKVLAVFLCVAVFILCGFEHVVANAAYYAYAGVCDGKTILWFAIMAVGNGIGSVVIHTMLRLIATKKQ